MLRIMSSAEDDEPPRGRAQSKGKKGNAAVYKTLRMCIREAMKFKRSGHLKVNADFLSKALSKRKEGTARRRCDLLHPIILTCCP